MAKKQPRVPETRDVKRNREQRRHPEKLERPENEALSREERPPQDPAPDVMDARAKNSGHRKKTAETWNQ